MFNKKKKNQKKQRKGIVAIRIIASLATFLYGAYLILCPWYLSNDAITARRCLQEITIEAKKIGIDTGIDMSGKNILKYPLPIVMMDIIDISTNWTNAYLGSIERDSIIANKEFEIIDNDKNPHNTLQKVAAYTNLQVLDVDKEAYELVAYHSAVTDPNPEQPINKEVLSAYIDTVTERKEKAVEHFKPFMKACIDRITLGIGLITIALYINMTITITDLLIPVLLRFKR